jgi:WD40 repeat protein
MMKDGAPEPFPAAAMVTDAERVDMIKARLVQRRAYDTELSLQLRVLGARLEFPPKRTAMLACACSRSKLGEGLLELQTTWHGTKAAHDGAMEHMTAVRKVAQVEIEAIESELDTAVNAPVSGGRDPTEWLPDELMLMVLERLPLTTLWSGACEHVCHRWARLVGSAPIERRKRLLRWAAFEAGTIRTHVLDGHTAFVNALAVGLDGRIYSGSADMTIRVWSGDSGAHLQTLQGHTGMVLALAVGLDGAIYSASYDLTIKVWSGASGALLRTLEGHTDYVMSLTVGSNGKIYSGSGDRSIRVWAADDGEHLQTLLGHTGFVRALAVGKRDGAIYSGSFDCTVRVWSGEDGTHLRTLEGHTNWIASITVAADGRVYSGSGDSTIRVWSPHDGKHLQTLMCHTSIVVALVVGLNGKLFSGSHDGVVRVWSDVDGAHLHTMRGGTGEVLALVLGHDGTLISGGGAPSNLAAPQVRLEMWK